MAAILSSTNVRRHVVGDLVIHFFTLSGVNGDTLTLPGITIGMVVVTPTTAISVGVTTSGSVATFVTGGAWAARVLVISRTG